LNFKNKVAFVTGTIKGIERATIVALSIPFIVPVTKATLFLKFNILN
jgi:hypothetical protein